MKPGLKAFSALVLFAPCPLIGCSAPIETFGVRVDIPTMEEQESFEGYNAPISELRIEETIRMVKAGLEGQRPFKVLAIMDLASRWVDSGPGGDEGRNERLASVSPFVNQYLSSKAPFSRMAGILFLRSTGDIHRFQAELRKSTSFLLARPENKDCVRPIPGEAPEITRKKSAAILMISTIIFYRSKLIESCGELRIRSARQDLEAIAADSNSELTKSTAEAARIAITKIDGKMQTTESPGKQPIREIPDQEPGKNK